MGKIVKTARSSGIFPNRSSIKSRNIMVKRIESVLSVDSSALNRYSIHKKIGGAYRTRTDDPFAASEVLSQLS